jgi:hypothetical protein
MISYGYVTIGGVKLYATPDDYALFDRGSKSQIIATSKGGILDVGFGVTGFTVNGWVLDASSIVNLDNIAKNALNSGTPISVTDTIYPGGKSWTGFLERPVIKTGQAFSGGSLGLPENIMLSAVPITFFSSTIEPL